MWFRKLPEGTRLGVHSAYHIPNRANAQGGFSAGGIVGRQGYIHALTPQANGSVERVPRRHMEEPCEVGDFFAACLLICDSIGRTGSLEVILWPMWWVLKVKLS